MRFFVKKNYKTNLSKRLIQHCRCWLRPILRATWRSWDRPTSAHLPTSFTTISGRESSTSTTTAKVRCTLRPNSTCVDLLRICCTTTCSTSPQQIESLQQIYAASYTINAHWNRRLTTNPPDLRSTNVLCTTIAVIFSGAGCIRGWWVYMSVRSVVWPLAYISVLLSIVLCYFFCTANKSSSSSSSSS